jgi:hypothetical protein
LKVQVLRRLTTPPAKGHHAYKPGTLAPEVTETVLSEELQGPPYDFGPGQDRAVVVHAPLPPGLHSYRGHKLFDVDIVLRIALKLGNGLSIRPHKEAVIELPIYVADVASMPLDAIHHRKQLAAREARATAYRRQSLPNPYSPPRSPQPFLPASSPTPQPYALSPSPHWAPTAFSPCASPIMATSPMSPLSPATPFNPYFAPIANQQQQLYMDPNAAPLTTSRFLAGLGLSPVHDQLPFSAPNQTAFYTQDHQYFQEPQAMDESAYDIPRPLSARGERSFSSPLPHRETSPVSLPPILQAALSPSDQERVLHNLAPSPSYVAAERTRLSQSAGPSTSKHKRDFTPPPSSPSAQYTDIFALPKVHDPLLALETIGEGGESRAGTLKNAPPDGAGGLTEMEIRSLSAIRVAGLPGSTSASRLEDLVADESWDDTMLLGPAPPVPTKSSPVVQAKPPRVMDIFRPVTPAAPPAPSAENLTRRPHVKTFRSTQLDTKDFAAVAAETRDKRRASLDANVPARDARPTMSGSKSEQALASLEARLARKPSPAASAADRPPSRSSSQTSLSRRVTGALRAKSSSVDLKDAVFDATVEKALPLPRSVSDSSALNDHRHVSDWLSKSSPVPLVEPPVERDVSTPVHRPIDDLVTADDSVSQVCVQPIKARTTPIVQMEACSEVQEKAVDEDRPKYDFKSARGGRGGKVTDLASLWSSQDSKVQPGLPNLLKQKCARVVRATAY